MMHALSTHFTELSSQMLKATLLGQTTEVERLLTLDKNLINAKTSAKQESLLHIAAARGHHELCHVLIQNGHTTNPVDLEGRTPYQRAKTDEIKSMLVELHMQHLFRTYFISDSIPNPKRDFVQSLNREIQIISKSEAAAHPLMQLELGFASTALSPPADGHYELITIFREDILMTPYYGELLVIHENEQVEQFLNLLSNSKTGFSEAERFPSEEMVRLEVQAYCKFISSGFRLFPFLKDYPLQSDRPDVALAKKMFIAFALTGCADYIQNCSPEQIQLVRQLGSFEEVTNHIEKTMCKRNAARNTAICDEMISIYSIKLEPTQPTSMGP